MRKVKENRLKAVSEVMGSDLVSPNNLAQTNGNGIIDRSKKGFGADRLTYFGFGKRKKARAYVRIAEGEGKITVNGLPIHRYFTIPYIRAKVTAPVRLAG